MKAKEIELVSVTKTLGKKEDTREGEEQKTEKKKQKSRERRGRPKSERKLLDKNIFVQLKNVLLKTRSSKQLKPILKLMCLNQQILKWQGENGKKKSSNCSRQVCTEVVNFSEQQKVTNLEKACQPIANLRYIKNNEKKPWKNYFFYCAFFPVFHSCSLKFYLQ